MLRRLFGQAGSLRSAAAVVRHSSDNHRTRKKSLSSPRLTVLVWPRLQVEERLACSSNSGRPLIDAQSKAAGSGGKGC